MHLHEGGTPRCRQRHSTVSSEAYGCEASDVHPVRNGPLMFRCVEPANGPEPRNSLEPVRGTQIALRLQSELIRGHQHDSPEYRRSASTSARLRLAACAAGALWKSSRVRP